MAGLSKVTINVGEGGLGRRAPNEDKISGIIFYNDTPPSGWTANSVKLVYTLEEAETLGLISTLVGSEHEHYQVSEYFRINPEGELYIGYYDVPAGAYDFAELPLMQVFAAGKIRQCAIYANALAFLAAQVTLIQTQVDLVDATGGRISVLYGADMTGFTDPTTLPDLRGDTAAKVSVVAGEDGGAVGAALAVSAGFSIPALGACLGAVSLSGVEESVGNPRKYNVSNGTELEVPALANGDLISALSASILGAIKDDGYTILRKYTPQLSGSYFERMPTAVVATSDFAWIEYNRVIDKAIRLVESALTPELNATLLLNDDGTLTDDTIGYFEDLCNTALEGMQADREISGKQVLIDPAKDVLATSTLEVTIKILPLGVAEFITVNIGFTANLT